MDITENLINKIPHYNKEKNLDFELVPFSIDYYIKRKYDKAFKEYKRKYNEEYMKNKLLKVKAELQQERDYYNKWFQRIFYNPFLNNLNNGNKKCKIHYNPYDIDRNKEETFMMEKALINFTYCLDIKGYKHKVWEERKQEIDFMDGTITKFTKYIEITL